MRKIEIEITDEQWVALTDVTTDPAAWLHNAAVARASAAVGDRRAQSGWMAAAVSFAQAGGDPEDDAKVLAHGVATGLFKDAASRAAEAAALAEAPAEAREVI
jgi:hypothetical protein